jgi:hypothetical protein
MLLERSGVAIPLNNKLDFARAIAFLHQRHASYGAKYINAIMSRLPQTYTTPRQVDLAAKREEPRMQCRRNASGMHQA